MKKKDEKERKKFIEEVQEKMAYRDQERINNFKEKKKQRKLQKRSRDESSGSQSMYQAKDSIKTSVGSSQL